MFGSYIDTINNKIVNVGVPGYTQLEEYAKKEFPQLSDLKIKYISKDAIIIWIKKSEDIQELLYKITDMQTYEMSKKSFDQIINVNILLEIYRMRRKRLE